MGKMYKKEKIILATLRFYAKLEKIVCKILTKSAKAYIIITVSIC